MHVKTNLILTKEERAIGAAEIALLQHTTIQAALMAACDAVGIGDSYLTADRLSTLLRPTRQFCLVPRLGGSK